jgi:hypothetical protein
VVRGAAFRLNFVFAGQHCDEILVALGGLHFGGKFDVNFLGMAVREACSAVWVRTEHLL